MHPNMDEELLLPHPDIVPSLAEASNIEPAFDRAEVCIVGYLVGLFPNSTRSEKTRFTFILHSLLCLTTEQAKYGHTSNSELSPTPTISSRSASEIDSSFSTASPFGEGFLNLLRCKSAAGVSDFFSCLDTDYKIIYCNCTYQKVLEAREDNTIEFR